jgi:hypothetical protein
MIDLSIKNEEIEHKYGFVAIFWISKSQKMNKTAKMSRTEGAAPRQPALSPFTRAWREVGGTPWLLTCQP